MLTKKSFFLLFLSILIVISITSIIYIFNVRSSIYPYDVTKDYEYSFNKNATFTNLNVEDGWITLPETQQLQQTVLLKLNVETTLLGKYLLPSIKLSDGESTLLEYLEHGAKGDRYINLSPLLSKDTTKLQLTGKHVSIDNQSTQLIVFDNNTINDDSKILVISPHPDDAEIAAYGLYSSYKNSHIITVTAGDAGGKTYDEILKDKKKHFLKKGQLRTWNSITVPMLGGIPPEQSLNLGFFDGTLEKMFKGKPEPVPAHKTKITDIHYFRNLNISSLSKGLSGESDWDSLVENFEYLLKTTRPNIIVTPYPALDTHYDHKLSSVALFEAIKNLGIKEGALYLYSNHYVLNEFYPYGKIGSIISMPPNFDNELYFDAIYSHSLSKDKQNNKLFALEAMHDLRLDTEWRSSKGAIELARENIERDVFGQNNSYYKRAVRSNELFFVVNISSLYDQATLDKIIGEL